MDDTPRTIEERLARIEFWLNPEGQMTVAAALHDRVRRDLMDIDHVRGAQLDGIEQLATTILKLGGPR